MTNDQAPMTIEKARMTNAQCHNPQSAIHNPQFPWSFHSALGTEFTRLGGHSAFDVA
jgi:hypothetical protein